jgi:hypothetical protein
MNINIPPDSRDWLFSSNHVSCDGASWSFRWPPPCEPNDPIYFRFDGKIVARACVYMIRKPGELDGWAHHGKRYLRGHKVIWLWSSFEDLRQNPEIVAAIEVRLKQRRAKRVTSHA